MNKTLIKNVGLCLLMGSSILNVSCSNEENDLTTSGSGSVTLGVTANAVFSTNTRAVNESSYSNTASYQVEILGSTGEEVTSFLYRDTPTSIKLANGSYTLKAHYGTESNASRDAFYVYGEQSFQIEGDNKTVSVNCYPTCGKLIASFDGNMSTYFSEYYVTYETETLSNASGGSITWAKADTEPWYVKLAKAGETVTATIHYTRISDSTSGTVTRRCTLKPCQSWTLGIAPLNENGNLTISITIDETTDDILKDIDVPTDWW